MDYSLFGSILGSPLFWETTNLVLWIRGFVGEGELRTPGCLSVGCRCGGCGTGFRRLAQVYSC